MKKNIIVNTGSQKYPVTIGKISSLKFEDKNILLITSKNLEHSVFRICVIHHKS